MRIYLVNLESKKFGINWRSKKVDAKSFDEAVRKAKKDLQAHERVLSIHLLASTE